MFLKSKWALGVIKKRQNGALTHNLVTRFDSNKAFLANDRHASFSERGDRSRDGMI